MVVVMVGVCWCGGISYVSFVVIGWLVVVGW